MRRCFWGRGGRGGRGRRGQQLQRLQDVSCTPARVIVVQTLAVVVHVFFSIVVGVAHLDNQRAVAVRSVAKMPPEAL